MKTRAHRLICLKAGYLGLSAGVFAAAVLIWALRQIDKFDLTDINRF